MTANDWFWLGFGGMALGSVSILAYGWNRRTRDEESHYFIHLFVCLTAMASYLVMATGAGSTRMPDGHQFYHARYIDWAITTPLLLTGLSLTALHTPFRRWALLLGLLFTDIYMIAAGALTDASPAGSSAKWTWYLISSGAFAFVYHALWGPLRAEANKSGPRAATLFRTNAGLLSVIWFAYPIIFLLGPEGAGSLDPTLSVAAYTITDLVAKVGYGLFSLTGTKRKTAADLRAGEVPDHDLRPAPVASRRVDAPGHPPA